VHTVGLASSRNFLLMTMLLCRSNRCGASRHRPDDYSLVYLHVRFSRTGVCATTVPLLTTHPSSIVCIHKRIENKFVFTFRGELVGLGVLWLFWIIGAAITSVSDLDSRRPNKHNMNLSRIPGEPYPGVSNTKRVESCPR